MKNLTVYFLFFVCGFVYLLLLGNASGGPAQTTGAPNEGSCGQNGCHAVMENQGDAAIALNFNNEQSFYVPGEVYPVQIALSNLQNDGKNGFQIVALDSLNENIGSWILADEAATQIRAGNSLSDRSYVTHTQAGVTETAWNINWQAPSELAGAVTFYLAVNDANNNGGRTGDNIYLTNLRIEGGNTTSTKELVASQINVFPNPTNGSIFIQSPDSKILTAELFSSAGQLLVRENQPTQIDITNFPLGIYYLSLTSPVGKVMKKVVLID